MSGGASDARPLHAAKGANPEFPGLEVIEEIAPGVGGMGVLYKAREVSLDRVVAVKTMKAHLRTPEGREFFVTEARAAARLDHPNILRIYRFVPEHTPPFYVMQFIEGRPLDQAVKGREPKVMAEIIEKVARALAFAHSRGIVHRDVKPDNVLVDFDNEPHVADFGLAGPFDEHALADTPARALGTPSYIAPELYANRSPAGPLADVYALGVTLYQLLTGRLPFVGKSVAEVREAVLNSEPQLPHELNPGVPEPLQRICLKAIERDPAQRYPSAQLMAEELRRFREGREVLARPTRYQRELSGRFENHLTEIRSWREQNLIDVRDMDRLSRPYHAILGAASPYHHLSRLFPWQTVLLRLGGWLVILGSLLWPAWYWDDLGSGWLRIAAVGLPTLLVNLIGWTLRMHGSRVNSLVYLSTGALLLGLFVAVVLAEGKLLEFRQSNSRELFDIAAQPSSFHPTNAQITVAAAVFTGYCAALLVLHPAQILAFWVGSGLWLVYSSMLLLFGLREWLELGSGHIARALVCYGAFALAFAPLALGLPRWERFAAFAPAFYSFFPLPFAFCFSLLAHYGAVEWLGSSGELDDPAMNRWLMVNGVVYFLAALASSRSAAAYVRFWGAFFMLLVPVHLLAPTHLLYDRGNALFQLGHTPFTTYELASLVIALVLAVLGTRIRQHALAVPALFGLAAFVLRATSRHFEHNLYWPLALVTLGGLAMTLARTSLSRSARSQHRGDV
jgi:serine/threonine protein kinase